MPQRQRHLLALLLALAVSALAGAPPAAAARVIQRLNYETGNFRQWTGLQALPGRARIIRSPVRQGRFAARFVVRPGDDPISAAGERAEVYALTNEGEGVESWWAWSTRFPVTFRANPGGWNMFTQWHHTGSVCPPPVQFTVDRDAGPAMLRLLVRGGRLDLRTCEASYEREWHFARLRRARWFDFRFHVRWSADPRVGFVEVRVNRRWRVRSAAATLYTGQGVYVKQGFYRGPGSTSTAVIHDGMRRYIP
jgi:hypothetical protein